MNTRQLAITALNKIFNKGIKPKEAIDELSINLDKRDRAFLMEIVYGVLRYRDYLDWMLRNFLKRPSGLSHNTLNNLRVAVYQLKYMRVPEWAVVDEAVNLERFNQGKRALVNAVLRNFLRHKEEIKYPPKDDSVEYISITTSHPRWLVQRWIKRFGFNEALKLAEANNRIAPVVLRAESAGKREEILKRFVEKGIEAYPTEFSPVGIVLKEFPSTEFLTHNLFFQDEAAQLVTYLLNPLPHEKVLDACAAPGGKTTHIAQMMKDSGEIAAVEAEEKRMKQLEENISRLRLKSIKIIHGNAMDLNKIDYFDRILLDAPCSSIGVIRRNPDVKYRHSGKDLIRYRENQLNMLKIVSRFLKRGGIMVYSVCSTEPEEGEDVIKEFLHDHPNFSIIKGDYDFLRHFEVLYAEGYLVYRTFPHRHNMDGFFAARLKKIA
ncbi:Sun protein [Dissulfurispira thermophila]|uniref:16S rRNA (cytosine(967)-C(5))-methyltransferase n=1 Tax=Dissulfurispira thermophila TaxID=2715679 RepID=A0A7G1H454_9BACT|nr:16S rRNA (cytosine(967)-C(5))-methyltransferase RsmB [Dissulfurispira thermophila]BCB96969.1 Sun protein [Dissulfurispira thermophila]